jgi:hypothetical protein
MNEVQHHFGQVLGTTGRRSSVVRWDHLGYAPFELSELDNSIDDSEIKDVVMGLQSKKAPRPGWVHWVVLQMLLRVDKKRPFHGNK